jgi:hypothetical protein
VLLLLLHEDGELLLLLGDRVTAEVAVLESACMD